MNTDHSFVEEGEMRGRGLKILGVFLSVLMLQSTALAGGLVISGDTVGIGTNTPVLPLDVVGDSSTAIHGHSDAYQGVYGSTVTGSGIYGTSNGSGYAGRFLGNVDVTGNQTVGGSVNAASFTGSGSGLTNVTASSASNLSCTGCVSPSHLNFTPGTVTSVASGTGLTGGPITTTGTLSVNFGGSGSASTVARSDHSHDTLYQAKYGKVAVVAQSGGDYTDPVTAMNDLATWCGTPSGTNPCLLKIMPGRYNIETSSLTTQSFVDIEGSGENVTVIIGATSYNPLVQVYGTSEIRFLTVTSTGGWGAAIYTDADGGNVKITNVTATASGGTYNYGIYNSCAYWNSRPVMTNVTAKASGGTRSYGIYNGYCFHPTWGGHTTESVMNNVTATASEGANNYGVYNDNSMPTMNNVTATASAGSGNNVHVYGVYNYSSSPTMTELMATASGGTQNFGVYDTDNSSSSMTNVTASALAGQDTYGIMITEHSSSTMTNVVANASGGSGGNNGVEVIWYSSVKATNLTATGSGGVYGAGFGNDGYNTTSIDHSLISGTSLSIHNAEFTTTYLGSTKLEGAVQNYGTLKCVGAYNGNYDPLGSNCL
jgi:hypothetical protein